jgi:serine acetyltransferase/glycosyltransferase involved in cell wall biosynthesis
VSKKLSVVVATFNRLPRLLELLADLAEQTVPAEQFEVVVVDDGSATPVGPRLAQLRLPYRLVQSVQQNAGPAAARHRGVLLAEGDIVVFVDDDMRVAQNFLAAHLNAHEAGKRVVQGYIAPPPDVAALPLFERFHAYQIERVADAVQRRLEPMHGIYLCTGNLSVRREDYLAAGGFDATLRNSEDRELGVRLEKRGLEPALSVEARSDHHSDHDSLDQWLARSFNYGVYDLRIARKHPDVDTADPWRFWFMVSPLSRPFLATALLAPRVAEPISRVVIETALGADRVGLERLALAGTTLCYGIAYFRGVRTEAGSLRAAARGFAHHLRQRRRALREEARRLHRGRLVVELPRFWHDLRADYVALIGHRAKYNRDKLTLRQLPQDLVRKIGVQMMATVRVMDLLRDTRMELGAQVVSRLIRHLYGAEIHWDASFAPGVTIIHGSGLVVSHAARIAEGCILFHNVTLGEGIDADTRRVGAPTLERNVHVGPGAILLGPIIVGEGSKIMAGAVLTRSVPPFSLVKPADISIMPRRSDARAVVQQAFATDTSAAGEAPETA